MSRDGSPSEEDRLRGLVLRGGIALVGRQVGAMCMSLLGLVVITRLLGPESYGSYTAAFITVQTLQLAAQTGVGVFLIRHATELSEREYRTASTLLLAASLLSVTGFELSAGFIESWLEIPGFSPVLRSLALVMPIQSLSAIAGARLDRALNFRWAAVIDLSSQAAYYAVGVPMAFLGAGVWSLVLAWIVQQTMSCMLLHFAANYTVQFGWDRPTAFRMLAYSLQYSARDWLGQFRLLAKTMILGHFLGAEAVAYAGLTNRVTEMLTFVRSIGWRLSIAAFARIQSEPEKLGKAINEAMELQTLAVGSVLLVFSWIGAAILLAISGERWSPIIDLFPYIALSYLTNAQFNMHISALQVLNHNTPIICFAASYFVIVVVSCIVLIPQFGLIAYGWAELLSLPSYLILHFAVVRLIGPLRYRVSVTWAIGTAIGLFWRQLGWWAIFVPFLALLFPESIRQIRSFLFTIRLAGRFST